MTFIIMVVILIGAAVAQAQAPAWVFFGHAKFPFLLAVVMYYALNREIHIMLISGFLAGIFHDALSHIPLGYSAACYCVLGLVAARFRRMVISESWITHVVFGAAGGAVATVCMYLMLRSGDYIGSSAGWVVMRAAGTGIMGMVCCPIVFFIIGRLDLMVGNIYTGESIDGIE